VNDSSALVANASAIAGSCLVGAAVVVTRLAVEDIDPIGLAFLRYAQGGLLLFAVLAISGKHVARPHRDDLPRLALLGLLMFAAFPVLFNAALTYTTASRGAVILATMPLWSAIIARRFASERLRARQGLGVLLSMSGIATVFAESAIRDAGAPSPVSGNALMLLAAMVGGLYAILAKPLIQRRSGLYVTAWAMVIGAVLLLVPAVVEGLLRQLPRTDASTILLVIYLGTLGGATAFWLIANGLSYLSPTQALVYVNLNPVVATLLGSIVLDEPLSLSFVAGFALVIAGLLLTNIPPRQTAVPATRPA
jgi:drug/metabolite transporter (DMT)-like permease